MIDLRYGVAYSFTMPVVKAGTDDLAESTDWTPATGDVLVSKDGAAAANISSLPTFISGANTLRWTLSDTEMEASEITIIIVDSATKAIKDNEFKVTTEAHNRIIVTLSGTPSAISMDSDITDPTGVHDSSILKFIKSTALKNAQAVVTTYTNTSGNFIFTAGKFPAAPSSGDLAILINR